MEYKTHRDETLKEVDVIYIHIHPNNYRLIEDEDGSLSITKYSNDTSDEILVKPRAMNSINIE